MSQQDHLHEELTRIKNATVPVDFNVQYEKILRRIEKRPLPVFSPVLLKPLIAVASFVVLFTGVSFYQQTSQQEIAAVDEFLASALTFYEVDNQSTTSTGIDLLIDGTFN